MKIECLELSEAAEQTAATPNSPDDDEMEWGDGFRSIAQVLTPILERCGVTSEMLQDTVPVAMARSGGSGND
jgi:hypothetical protein